MFWGKKSTKPDKKAVDAAPDGLVTSLGGESEYERLERELSDYRKKGITVRMETDGDGRKVLVPVEPEPKNGRRK